MADLTGRPGWSDEGVTEIKSKCVVCKKPLVCEVRYRYLGDPMHMIIGPGSRNQMSRVVRIRCDTCGLGYDQPPKEAP